MNLKILTNFYAYSIYKLPALFLKGAHMLKIEDHERACRTAAKLVEKFGDKYLPIFERTYNELKQAQQMDNIKAVAMQFAHDQLS